MVNFLTHFIAVFLRVHAGQRSFAGIDAQSGFCYRCSFLTYHVGNIEHVFENLGSTRLSGFRVLVAKLFMLSQPAEFG